MNKVVIFGASTGGQNAFQHLTTQANFDVMAFVDNDPAKQGDTLYGKPIIAPAAIKKDEIDLIFIASSYSDEIWQQLLQLGFPPKQIQALEASVLMGTKKSGGRMLLVAAAFVVVALLAWFLFR